MSPRRHGGAYTRTSFRLLPGWCIGHTVAPGVKGLGLGACPSPNLISLVCNRLQFHSRLCLVSTGSLGNLQGGVLALLYLDNIVLSDTVLIFNQLSILN